MVVVRAPFRLFPCTLRVRSRLLSRLSLPYVRRVISGAVPLLLSWIFFVFAVLWLIRVTPLMPFRLLVSLLLPPPVFLLPVPPFPLLLFSLLIPEFLVLHLDISCIALRACLRFYNGAFLVLNAFHLSTCPTLTFRTENQCAASLTAFVALVSPLLRMARVFSGGIWGVDVEVHALGSAQAGRPPRLRAALRRQRGLHVGKSDKCDSLAIS